MNEKFNITCDDNGLINDKEFIFNLQKAMLASLFESKKINHFQYEYALELLEKNFKNK